MTTVNASARLKIMAATTIPNAKYAYAEFYMKHFYMYSTVFDPDVSSFMDGVALHAIEKYKEKAFKKWVVLAKQLAPNFKMTNPQYGSGTFHDEVSKTEWEVSVLTDSGTQLRFKKLGKEREWPVSINTRRK